MKELEVRMRLPGEVLDSLGIEPEKAGIELRKELSLHFFGQGTLTFGQARRLAGLSKWEFMEFLCDKRVPLHYDMKEFKEDLATIKELIRLRRTR